MTWVGTMLKTSLLVAGMLVPWLAQGQFVQTHRYEREQSNADNAWAIVSMRNHGIALVRDMEKFKDGQRLFQLVTLDSALQETWSTEIALSNRLRLVGYDYTDSLLYLLFREGDTDDGDLSVTTVSLVSRQVDTREIKHEFNLKLTHFWVVNGNMLFGGYVNREPAVLLYKTSDQQLKVVPGFFTSETELLDLRVNQNNTFNALVINRASRAHKTLVLRTFDAEGVLLLEDEVTVDQNKTILTGLTSSLQRDELLIAGTYTAGIAKQASGIYTVVADPFKDQAINYYDFGQLNHAFDFMNPKRALKIYEQSRRDRLHGRDPDYRIYASSVRLDENANGFLLLAELYNMSSGMNNYPYQGNPYFAGPYGLYPFTPYSSRFYNSPYSYNNQLPNSDVNILESLVVAVAPDGKLDWDHGLKLKDKRKPALEQSSDFWASKDKIVLVSKLESDIYAYARYKNNETERDTLQVKLKNPTDLIRNESKEDEGVRHWYDQFFYVWGYQSLKDPAIVNEDRTRSVFYLVKLHVR